MASNEPVSKPLVKLKYMGKAYQTSLTEVVTNKVVLTYRGIRYCALSLIGILC